MDLLFDVAPTSGYGPLHAGRWLLSSRVPRLRTLWRWERYAADADYFYFEGDWPVLPLRTPAARACSSTATWSRRRSSGATRVPAGR